MKWIYLSVCVALIVISIFLYALYRRNQKKILELTGEIERFIVDGKPTAFSAEDNAVARLQNQICELEHLLTMEKTNTIAEMQKNSDFIADISHQLKTPLAGIRLYCELRGATEETDPYVQKELILIEKMENLIYKLLRLEKLLADAYVLDFAEHPLDVLIQQTLGEFRHLFPQKKFIVEGGGVFRCDRAWMQEAVGNLIKNAAEHTSPDGVITVRLAANSQYAEIVIEDDGGGMPDDEIKKLFGRFYRTETSPPSSTGIGMSITKAVVEKHHGTISAQNSAKGLKITMAFPVIDGNLKI